MYMPTHKYSHDAIKFTRDGGHNTRGCYSQNTTTSYSMIFDCIDSIFDTRYYLSWKGSRYLILNTQQFVINSHSIVG